MMLATDGRFLWNVGALLPTYVASYPIPMDRIPLAWDFPRLTPRPTHPPVQCLPGLSGGYSGRSMVLITQLLVAPSCEGVVDTPLPTLCTCIGMSWIDLYLTNSMMQGTSWETARLSYNPKVHFRAYNVDGNKIITQKTAVIVCMSHQTDPVGWALSRPTSVYYVSGAVLAENFRACPLPL